MFKKKHEPAAVSSTTAIKSKVNKQKKLKVLSREEKVHLQVKNLHKFMQKIDKIDPTIIVTKELKPTSK